MKSFLYNFSPLYTLYRKGPWLNGFGFWAGKSDEEVCSYLSHTDIGIWNNNLSQCQHMIQKHYESLEIIVLFCMYILVCYQLLFWGLQYIFFWRHFQNNYVIMSKDTPRKKLKK